MFFAPGETPDDIVKKLNLAIRKALQVPALAGIMQPDGYIPDDRDLAATAAFFRQEVLQAAEAVKAAGIVPNDGPRWPTALSVSGVAAWRRAHVTRGGDLQCCTEST